MSLTLIIATHEFSDLQKMIKVIYVKIGPRVKNYVFNIPVGLLKKINYNNKFTLIHSYLRNKKTICIAWCFNLLHGKMWVFLSCSLSLPAVPSFSLILASKFAHSLSMGKVRTKFVKKVERRGNSQPNILWSKVHKSRGGTIFVVYV